MGTELVCILPGLKFSITTSQRSASCRTILFGVTVSLSPHFVVKKVKEKEKWTGRGNTYARPSSLRISIVTLFLLRPILRNQGLVPSMSSSRHTLRGSPVFGGSTLTTSAPKCLDTVKISHVSLERRREKGSERGRTHASNCPEKGPAISCPSSRTRTPDNGRLFDDASVVLVECQQT